MKYNLIYADPCWRYNFSRSTSRRIENHYCTMGTKDICNLGSRLPIEKDCLLLMWATAPKIREAFSVIDAWGFRYKTQMIWDKVNQGMGFWARGQHEILLVATRGKVSPPLPAFRRPSIFVEKRTRHSKKPECVYRWIDEAFPEAKKLELFARCRFNEGWAVWGNEAPGSILL